MTTSAAMRAYGHRFGTMGCPAEIRLYARDRGAARAAFLSVESECARLDRKYSHYRADSYLSDLQRRAALPPGASVDPETAALLNLAATQHRESLGRFDITAGRLSALWERRCTLPGAKEIAEALSVTGWHKVEWDGGRLRLPTGMRLDLGGIVKEYAVDRAGVLLQSCGFASGYVDLGGDLHVLGPHPDGSSWSIGIRNPRGPGALARIPISCGGLATSGDYERCSILNGARYSHMINPTTGWPMNGLATVSVVAPSCLLAGAVSTMAMLMEVDEGLEFLSESGLSWLASDGKRSFAGAA